LAALLHGMGVSQTLRRHLISAGRPSGWALAHILVYIWNSLPNFVVDVDTVCLFKARLDKFWLHQDVLYHHHRLLRH